MSSRSIFTSDRFNFKVIYNFIPRSPLHTHTHTKQTNKKQKQKQKNHHKTKQNKTLSRIQRIKIIKMLLIWLIWFRNFIFSRYIIKYSFSLQRKRFWYFSQSQEKHFIFWPNLNILKVKILCNIRVK